MKNISIARRYAKALYELAEEQNAVADVLQGLTNLSLAHRDSPKLGAALNNPLITPEEKRAVVKTVTSNKLILKLVVILAERKRMGLLLLVGDLFQQFNDAKEGVNRVLVKTPIVLTGDQKKWIEKGLSGSLGGKIIGKFEVAKELIGGIWIKMGDRVLDTSLRGQIEDLRHTLIHSAN